MTADDQRDLRSRAQSILRAPVPPTVRNGSANAAAEFKQACAIFTAFVRSGTQLERTRLAVCRLEAMQAAST